MNESIKSHQPVNLKARLEAQESFKRAIEQDRLSDDPEADNYAGKYMFMYKQQGQDLFKNINTRRYDV